MAPEPKGSSCRFRELHSAGHGAIRYWGARYCLSGEELRRTIFPIESIRYREIRSPADSLTAKKAVLGVDMHLNEGRYWAQPAFGTGPAPAAAGSAESKGERHGPFWYLTVTLGRARTKRKTKGIKNAWRGNERSSREFCLAFMRRREAGSQTPLASPLFEQGFRFPMDHSMNAERQKGASDPVELSPRFRHRFSSDPAARRAPLPRHTR